MFCSVIIPTVGRATLARAVNSVLSQSFTVDTFEIVVVNDSGRPLPPEPWQDALQVRILTTQKHGSRQARNSGAAVARALYLLFLDDDDWLLPGALDYFWQMAQAHPHCGCLYGSFEMVDDQEQPIAYYRLPSGRDGNVSLQLISGLWLQVASVLVRTGAFFAAGGFPPRFKISEELDLFNRLALREDFAGQDVLVARISRGQAWQTTADYTDLYEYNRLARDRALSQPGAFQRLQHAAHNSYWHGRILRLYLLSMLWNWRRKKRFFTGLSRGLFGLKSILYAHKYLLAKDYWRAVRHDVPQIQKNS
jgi:glycosyltransferase involved in cell wall biosynthesis